LVEHLLCKQGVVGSSPIVSTDRACRPTKRRTRSWSTVGPRRPESSW